MLQRKESSDKVQRNANYAAGPMPTYQSIAWEYAGSALGLTLKDLDSRNTCKMTLNDTLSNILSHILNCEKAGKKECIVSISSKLIKQVLQIMKDNKYIGDFKEEGGEVKKYLKINLLGKINKCGAIKPRFSTKKDQLEKYEKRFLPAKDFGIIILSTNKGLITHYKAKEKDLGGRLISYVY